MNASTLFNLCAHRLQGYRSSRGSMMMMILHQVRHGRQDNHATNHVRCAATSRSKQSRRHIEATRPNIARPYTSQSCASMLSPASKLQHMRNAARHNTTRVTLVCWPRLPPPAWLARGSGTGAPGGCRARTSGICGCSSQRAVTADKDADMFVAGAGAPSQPPHRRAQALAPHISQRLWLRVWPPAALIRVRRSVDGTKWCACDVLPAYSWKRAWPERWRRYSCQCAAACSASTAMKSGRSPGQSPCAQTVGSGVRCIRDEWCIVRDASITGRAVRQGGSRKS
jgi:hypothetical protein